MLSVSFQRASMTTLDWWRAGVKS